MAGCSRPGTRAPTFVAEFAEVLRRDGPPIPRVPASRTTRGGIEPFIMADVFEQVNDRSRPHRSTLSG